MAFTKLQDALKLSLLCRRKFFKNPTQAHALCKTRAAGEADLLEVTWAQRLVQAICLISTLISSL